MALKIKGLYALSALIPPTLQAGGIRATFSKVKCTYCIINTKGPMPVVLPSQPTLHGRSLRRFLTRKMRLV